MKLVLPQDIAGCELEFDVYDEKGVLLYKQGEKISPDFALKVNANNTYLYRVDEKIRLEDFAVEPEMAEDKTENKSIYSEKTKEHLIESSKKILQSIVDGGAIETKICDEVKCVVVNEVASKVDKIKGMDELRVFDKYTFSHTINVCSMSTALAYFLGASEDEINELATGALLHDIGKMLVPKQILLKPGRLEPEEFEIMKAHTSRGYDYIKEKTDFPDKIAKVALEHQEKYSGTGYPGKLKRDEISYFAQIASIVDVYDALISKRVYKPGLSNAESLRIMLSEGSKSFNPYMLYRFIYVANYKEKSCLVE